jgi:hypothetical protein
MDDCDLVDLCKEFRNVDEVITYLRQNLQCGLWRKAKERDPLHSARRAREEKRKAKIAKGKKEDEEKKAKKVARA